LSIFSHYGKYFSKATIFFSVLNDISIFIFFALPNTFFFHFPFVYHQFLYPLLFIPIPLLLLVVKPNLLFSNELSYSIVKFDRLIPPHQ